MFKRILITYYAVWYMAHKNSKHAKDFSHYWFHAMLQVAVTAFAVLMISISILEEIIGIRVMTYPGVIYAIGIIPGLILYYLIFHQYGVDKNAKDEDFNYLNINKSKKITAWFFFIGINLSMILTFYVLTKIK